jgi:hypothetical protein
MVFLYINYCKVVNGGRMDIKIPEMHIGRRDTDHVIAKLRDYECLEPASYLPESQQERIFTIAYNNLNNQYQKGLLFAGYTAVKNSGLITSDDGCVYAGIRGSVSRATADESEDGDVFAISSDKKKTMEDLRDSCLEQSIKLKEAFPGFKRDEKSLVVPLVYDSSIWNLFLEDPIFVDMQEPDISHTESQYRRIMRFQNHIKYDAQKVLSEPYADPFEFIENAVRIGNNKSYGFWLKPKDICHNLIATTSRTMGIHLRGDVPKNKIVEVRDKFLEGLLKEEGVY